MWKSLSVTYTRSVVFSGYSGLPNTNKTDCHDITEILLKMVLNIITLTLPLTHSQINIITLFLEVHPAKARLLPKIKKLRSGLMRVHLFLIKIIIACFHLWQFSRETLVKKKDLVYVSHVINASESAGCADKSNI
jgi:hypothetical protein